MMNMIEGWDNGTLRVMLHNMAYIVQHFPQRPIPPPERET